MSTSLNLDVLNTAASTEFVSALAPLFEGAPRFLARLAADRPYADWAALFRHARETAHRMPEGEQVELIDAHPRLGAPAATMSALSAREQAHERGAGEPVRGAVEPERGAVEPDRLSEEGERVTAELDRLNAAYEARFGFRYCVHVAGRTRAELLPGLAASIDAAPETERHRALDAVVDIAIDRHATMHPEPR